MCTPHPPNPCSAAQPFPGPAVKRRGGKKKRSRLRKCVDAVRSLIMSIFLLVRFVTSVTREKDKKKSLFPLCDDDDDDVEDAWPFSPAGALFFFSCERRRRERACGILLKMYLFLPSKKTQDASVFPAEELASAGWLNPQKLGRGDCDGRERDAEKEGGGGEA